MPHDHTPDYPPPFYVRLPDGTLKATGESIPHGGTTMNDAAHEIAQRELRLKALDYAMQMVAFSRPRSTQAATEAPVVDCQQVVRIARDILAFIEGK